MMSQNIEKYKKFLYQWNARYGLIGSSITFDKLEQQAELLFLCFQEYCAKYNLQFNEFEYIDIGSGNGFPGIFFAIWGLDTLKTTIVERRQNRTIFLNFCVTSLALQNTQIALADISKFNLVKEKKYTCITAQAFASLFNTAELTYHLWDENTIGLFLKTNSYKDEIELLNSKYTFNHEIFNNEFGAIVLISNLQKNNNN